MKTAADVINRLKWDSTLPAKEFTVGYLDRFVGVVELPFEEFEKNDFTNASPDEFGVPEHRIQYFKVRFD